MVDESRVLMAVSRMIRRAVQHSMDDAAPEAVPEKPAHIRFAAPAHEEWHECQDQQWHDVQDPDEPVTTKETGSYHCHSKHEMVTTKETDMSRFWVEKGARKHRKHMSLFSAQSSF